MSDEYDLYDALRDACYRASEAGWAKSAILTELDAIIELVTTDDDEFPEESA